MMVTTRSHMYLVGDELVVDATLSQRHQLIVRTGLVHLAVFEAEYDVSVFNRR